MNEKSKRQTDGHIGRQVNVRLKDADAERLDRLTAKHGGIAPTIKAALKALEGSNELTNEELLSTLRARLTSTKSGNIDRETDFPPKSVKQNLPSQKIITPPKR